MRSHSVVVAGILAAVVLCACSQQGTEASASQEVALAQDAPEAPAPGLGGGLPTKVENDGFAVMISDAGPVYIAGQPSEAALEGMKAEGVMKVINLRTEAEMSNPDMVPFDEAAKVETLGMDYVLIPQGPEDTYTPAAVDAFAAAMADADGKVLVHCGSGVRASHMWAAYLVREKGMSLEEALKVAGAMNLKSEEPVRALLGISG